MEIDIETEFADRAYAILASLVTPRPIAFVTSISPDGKINAAPFSFFNLLGADPPILAIAPGDRVDGTPKDTARNIRLMHEFVVNLVDESIAEAMNKCAASLPYGANELDHAGLHTREVSDVRADRVLAPKLHAKSLSTQSLPELPLGCVHVSAKRSSTIGFRRAHATKTCCFDLGCQSSL